jgi:hypothetical protein
LSDSGTAAAAVGGVTFTGTPVFTDAEWRAIKAMCGPTKDG